MSLSLSGEATEMVESFGRASKITSSSEYYNGVNYCERGVT